MRSDFLGDCARFPGLPEAVNEGQYLVPRLTRDERRAAITGPTAVGGGEISPVLLTRLVNDVGDNPDQLSILQHALNRTWAQWQRERHGSEPISLSHYEAIGTMAHALDQHAERAFAELATERQKKICEVVFQALTDKGSDARGVRRPTDFATLCAIANASADEVSAVLDVFRKPSRSFLMPPAAEPAGAGQHHRHFPRKPDASLDPAKRLGGTRSRVGSAILSPGPECHAACQGCGGPDDRPGAFAHAGVAADVGSLPPRGPNVITSVSRKPLSSWSRAVTLAMPRCCWKKKRRGALSAVLVAFPQFSSWPS